MKNYIRNMAAGILTCIAITMTATSPAQANDGEQYVGEIKFFAGNFAPRGWAFCDGQLLPVASHDALFSLLGTIYGGDGRTTFALPDMRGRMPVHQGTGPGLEQFQIGARNGGDTVAAGEGDGHTSATVGLNCIISLVGIYPSRH